MEWIHTRWRKTENAELTEESHLEGSPILKEVTDAIKNMKTKKNSWTRYHSRGITRTRDFKQKY